MSQQRKQKKWRLEGWGKPLLLDRPRGGVMRKLLRGSISLLLNKNINIAYIECIRSVKKAFVDFTP